MSRSLCRCQAGVSGLTGIVIRSQDKHRSWHSLRQSFQRGDKVAAGENTAHCFAHRKRHGRRSRKALSHPTPLWWMQWNRTNWKEAVTAAHLTAILKPLVSVRCDTLKRNKHLMSALNAVNGYDQLPVMVQPCTQRRYGFPVEIRMITRSKPQGRPLPRRPFTGHPPPDAHFLFLSFSRQLAGSA